MPGQRGTRNVGRYEALAAATIALGWAAAAGGGKLIFGTLTPTLPSPQLLTNTALAPVLIWLGGGLITGLVLWIAEPSFRWHHVLLLTSGWGLAAPFAWAVRAAIGATITLLALRRSSPDLSFLASITIVAAWAAGWIVPAGVARLLIGTTSLAPINAALSGMLMGATGGAATLIALHYARRDNTKPRTSARSRSIAGMLRTLPSNPVMARLASIDLERPMYVLLGAIFGVGIAILLVSMSLWRNLRAIPGASSSIIPLLLYLVTLAPTVRAPLVVSGLGALLTGRDAGRQQFQLLRLTPISDREIAWAYTLTPLRLTRGLLTFEYTAMLLMSAAAMCAFLPSFTNWDETTTLLLLTGLVMLSIGMVGLNLLAAAVGMRIALRFRDPNLSAAVTLGVVLILSLLMMLAAIDALAAAANNPSLAVLAGFLLIMAAPYVTALELMDSTHPWAEARDA